MTQMNHRMRAIVAHPAFVFGLLTLLLWGLVVSVLAPPFLSFDSYHYLFLSVRPVAFDSHPLGLGFILLGLSKIADLLRPASFVYLFLLFQCVCLCAVCWQGFSTLRKIEPAAAHARRALLIRALLVVVAFGPVWLASLFLVNAVWSELAALAAAAVGLACVRKMRQRIWLPLLLGASAGLAAYNIRYQMIVLPFALIGAGVLCILKDGARRRSETSKAMAKGAIAVGASMFLAVYAGNAVQRVSLPNSVGRDAVTTIVVTKSIQCALRCDVALYDVNCSTPEGREFVTSAKCTDWVYGLKPTGAPRVAYSQPVTDVLRFIGPWNTAKWLVMAPLTYLSDIHGLEMGLFKFGADKAATHYPAAVSYYAKYFENALGGTATPIFMRLVHFLNESFFNRVFHVLTALFVLSSLFVLWVARRFEALFFAMLTLGMYLSFAYLQPSAPFRYLMLIIIPGCFSFLYVIERALIRSQPGTQAREEVASQSRAA